MLKKYNQYIKESLLDKLEGPNEEEVWKNLGYDRTFNTPKEFIDYIIANSTETDSSVSDSKEYELNGNYIYRIYTHRNYKHISISDEFQKPLKYIFNLDRDDQKDLFYNYFNNKINKYKLTKNTINIHLNII